MPTPRVFYLTQNSSLFTQIEQVLSREKFLLTFVPDLQALRDLLALETPNLVLCDLPLPEKPGLQTLNALQILCHTPIVLLGASSSNSLKPLILQRGAFYLEHSAKCLPELPKLLSTVLKPPAPTSSERPNPNQLILENLVDSIWLLDMSLRPLYITPNTQKLLGYSIPELQTMSVADLMPPDSLQKLNSLLDEVFSPENLNPADKRPSAAHLLILELFRKNAPPIWVEIDLNLLRDGRNNPTGILAVCRDISARKESEKLQNAVFQIAQLAYSISNLSELYPSIHRILGTLMRSDNFYIAFLDTAKNLIEFPYFVDEFDPPPPPRPFAHGLTEYVIRTGQPVLASPQLFENLVQQQEVESVGTSSFDWLGVPLNVSGKTIGMMAVQTYIEGKRYTDHDLEILTFVSNQVAMVIERKRIEEISNRYAAIANNAGELMSLIDRNYAYVAVNDAYCRRCRLSREEIVGRTVMEMWGQDSFSRVIRNSLDRCFNGQEIHNEDWFDFNGLNYGYYKVSYYPYHNENQEITHAIVITHDITHHKLSESALQRRLEMEQMVAATTFNLINVPANRMDAEIEKVLGTMGEFIIADRSFLNWLTEDFKNIEKRMEWCAPGIAPRNQRFLKQDIQGFGHFFSKLLEGQTLVLSPQESSDPEIADLRQEGIRSLLILPLNDRGTFFGTLGFETLQNDRAWIPEDVEMLKVIGQVIASAQRRRRSEQALARERNLLRTLVDNLPDMVYLKDLNRRFRLVNATLQQALGETNEQEMIGKDDNDYYPPELAAQFMADDQSVLSGNALINREEPGADLNGQRRWMLTTKIPLYDEDGKIEGLIGIGRNISERKRSEEAIRHRLTFETEVAVISARFINAAPNQIDTEIYSALQSLGQLSEMDRCYVCWLNSHQDQLIQVIEWRSPQSGSQPLNNAMKSISPAAWSMKKLINGEIIHAPHLADLPPEAADEVKIWKAVGIQSLVFIPVISGGKMLGILGFLTEQHSHTWLAEDIQMLRLVSEILGNAEQHKRTAEALARRNAILEAMNFAAGQFLSQTQLDKAIQSTIQRFGEATRVSRVYLFKNIPSNDNKTHATQTHEWTAENVAPQIDHPALVQFCYEDEGYSRWRDMLNQGKIIHGDVSTFPPEEYALLAAQDIRSILVVPIFVNKHWWGFMGFDDCWQAEREWLDAEREALRTAAALVGNGLLRQQTEDDLRENELKFRSVITQSIDGITLTDQNGILIEWNHYQELLTGVKREKALGHSIWDVMHQLNPADRQTNDLYEKKRQLVLEALQNRQAPWIGVPTIQQIHRKDGKQVLIQSTSFLIETPQGVMLGTSNRDITKEKEAEMRLRDSEQRFRAVFENAGIGIILMNNEGKILQSNLNIQNMLGYNEEEMLNLSLQDITHPEDYPQDERRFRIPHGHKRSNSYQAEKRYRRKDSKIVWGLLSATTIYDENEAPIYGLVIIQNIDERKHAEEVIRETQEQLSARVQELETNARQITLLTELSNMLQLSSNPHEVYGGITRYGSHIFPDLEGALFILEENNLNLHLQTSWGNPSVSENSLQREDCWAIRRVRQYLVSDAAQHGLLCRHIGAERPTSSICLPVTIQSQVVGLLNIQSRKPGFSMTAAQQQFAAALAEQIGLTLSNIQLRSSMTRMMIQDPLTGLYNRLYLEEALQRELQRATSEVSVIKIDLDNLTQINSAHGFSCGDSLLRELGKLLKGLLRPIDIACRTGGDEFILILTDLGEQETIAKVNELRQHLKAFNLPDQEMITLNITISCGIAFWPKNGLSASDLILAAENALNRAKQNGGNSIEFMV